MAYDQYIPDEDPYFAWARQQQLALEQAAPPPPPPPPPPTSTLGPRGRNMLGPALGGAAPQDEQAAAPARLSPEEEAAIAIDEPEKPGVPEEPDAVSGAAPAPGVTERTDVSIEQPQQAPTPQPGQDGYLQYMQGKADQQPLPSMAEQVMGDAEQKSIAAMSPEDYAVYRDSKYREAAMRAQQESERRAAADLYLQQQAAMQAHQQTQDMMRRADALANEKVVVPHAGLKDALGIVLGGMFSQGGPNMALAQFNKRVDAEIAAQTQNIQNQYRGLDLRNNAIASEYQRQGDLYRAQETYRLAAYTSAVNNLDGEIQKYDPAGATAMRLRDTKNQFEAARQQAAMAVQKQNLDDAYKQAQIDAQAANALKTKAETEKLRLESEALRRKNAGIGQGTAAPQTEAPLPPDYYKSLGLVPPPAPMSADAYKQWLELRKSGSEAQKTQQEAESNAAAGVVSKPNGDFAPITGKDGKPIRIDPGTAKELNEKNVGAQNVVSDLNDIKRMLDEDPSSVDRKKWAEIQARIGQEIPEMAHYYGAKFSSREEDAIKDIQNLDFDSLISRLKDKGTAVASINGIVDTIKRSVDTHNSATLHTPVNGVLSDTGNAPKPQPTEVDRLIGQLSTPNTAKADPSKLVELYTTPDERRSMAAGALLGLAQSRAAQNPAPSGADRAALLGRVEKFASSTIAQHSGRYYLVDADGKDIPGVPPAENEAGAKALLKQYRDAARAGLAKLSGDSEDQDVRERAGGDSVGSVLGSTSTEEQ